MQDNSGTRRDWSGGYPVGLGYVETVQPVMSAASIARVALVKQKRPPDPRRPYRYCELGCGVGGTLTALAAAAPHAEFLGVDYMPLHVATARHTARALGLRNLRVEEADFLALASQPPPGGRFDFMTLHGVWSWVSEAHRAALLRLIDGWLEPGGLAYVSYNARPYWNAIDPLRYVLRELLGARPETVDRAALDQTVDAWAATQNPAIQAFWQQRLRKLPTTYLIHEFGASEAQAFWPMDVADRMGQARLGFTGHAEIDRNFPRLVLDDDARVALETGRAAGFPRAADDLAMAHSFRQDIFDRGAPVLSPEQVLDALEGWQVRAAVPPPSGDAGTALSPALEQSLADLVARLPCDVATGLECFQGPVSTRLQAMLLALALKRLALVLPPAPEAEAGIERFNVHAIQRRASGETVPGLICAQRGEIIPLRAADFAAVTGDEAPERDTWLGQFEFRGTQRTGSGRK